MHQAKLYRLFFCFYLFNMFYIYNMMFGLGTYANLNKYLHYDIIQIYYKEYPSASTDTTLTHLVSFIFPESTTNTQSSMVTDVSAILVDKMIFRTPFGGFL